MSKHTPGPLIITKGDEWTDCIHTETADQGIWTVASVNKRRDEFEANRALIAAAPDLLAALKLCTFDSLNMSLADLEFCRAAYLKATGEQA